MNKNDEGPAFPCVIGISPHPGMSLRDWFAGQALAGWGEAHHMETTAYHDDGYVQDMARVAYEIADAMLKAREQ